MIKNSKKQVEKLQENTKNNGKESFNGIVTGTKTTNTTRFYNQNENKMHV
jgi:hypothetical protein